MATPLEDRSPEQRSLLDDPSDITKPTLPVPSASPSGPLKSPSTRHRTGYARVSSVPVIDEGSVLQPPPDLLMEDEITPAPRVDGLGIVYSAEIPPRVQRGSVQQARRALADQKRISSPPISPPSTSFSGTTTFDGSPQVFEDSTEHLTSMRVPDKRSMASLQSIQPSTYAKSDAGLVSNQSKYEEWQAEHRDICHSPREVKQRMGGCLSVSVLILAIFSTALSLIFLILAVRGPRYGRRIYSHGSLTPGTAAFLTSLFAKLIELSFVTSVVAFLGQALARRAFKREDVRGVTLAEIGMRSWIMQPGTMISNWQSVRYAGITLLGVVSLVAAINAALYTSAATALVQPQLKFPSWSPMVMQGLVKTEFANPAYIGMNCKTPIQPLYDSANYQITCLDMEFASQAYHNYFSYLGTWTDVANNGTGSSVLSERPQGFALVDDNTTVTASWVERSNMTELYAQYGFIVNNISMAMPHPGVMQAARDPINNILQPEELSTDGLGVYNIIASVPSPVVKSLCVTMNATQLKPLVWSLWDANANATVNMSTWPAQLAYSDNFLGGTEFDQVFGWGPAFGSYKYPPVFGELPLDYNSILNDTSHMGYGRDAIYLLAKGGKFDSVGSPTNDQNYALCQLQVSWTSNCSTHFNASASGSKLQASCENVNDTLRYIVSEELAHSGNATISRDWPNVGGELIRALNLNNPVQGLNSSNARLLTQLIIPATAAPQLNPALPSIAEALAVMAGDTLILSANDAPFTTFWNYTHVTTTGQYQSFNTSIRAQEFASGGTQPYQKAFLVVLFLTFLINFLILIYFCVHRDWYTDFSEPTTLFSLAVNSPPSKELAGSCGGGPYGNHFRVPWKLNSEGEHVYMESRERDPEYDGAKLRRRTLTESYDMVMTPVRKVTAKFEKTKS